MFKIGIFVSDEGFGHSVRQKNLIIEFLNRYPKSKITIFNKNRILFFKEYFGNKINYVLYPNTLSTFKKKNGELDLKKTKFKLKKWKKNSNIYLNKIIKKNYKFDLIISDLVPEAFKYAKILDIPSFGVARFAWDWFFFYAKFRKEKNIKEISKNLKLADKIFFPSFTNKISLSKQLKNTKLTNLIFNSKTFKEETHYIAKSKNQMKCLIMDNGTKTNSTLIMKTLKYLKNMPHIDFYISVDNYSNAIKKIVSNEKNIIPITGLKNAHYLISYVDFLIARGGFNTITEILYFKKPALLIDEKNNPEISKNLYEIKKLKLSAVMKQNQFVSNFEKRINYFINYEIKNIKKNLINHNIKHNGSKQIVKEIVKIVKTNA